MCVHEHFGTILKHTMPRSEPGLLVICFNMAGTVRIELTTSESKSGVIPFHQFPSEYGSWSLRQLLLSQGYLYRFRIIGYFSAQRISSPNPNLATLPYWNTLLSLWSPPRIGIEMCFTMASVYGIEPQSMILEITMLPLHYTEHCKLKINPL